MKLLLFLETFQGFGRFFVGFKKMWRNTAFVQGVLKFHTEKCAGGIAGHTGIESLCETLYHNCILIGEIRVNGKPIIVHDGRNLLSVGLQNSCNRLLNLQNLVFPADAETFKVYKERAGIFVQDQALYERHTKQVFLNSHDSMVENS